MGSVVIGCATTRTPPPPLQTYELGTSRATFRDYAAADTSICTAERRWLQDELASVNGVLARWLDRTSAGPEGVWTREQLDLLEQGVQTLPPVLEIHAKALEDLERCDFHDQGAMPDLRQRGREFIQMARRRIEDAPNTLAYVTAKAQLDAWREERTARQRNARSVCPERPKVGTPQLYYGWQDEEGRQQWLFCDGAKVVSRGSEALHFEPPAGASRKELRRVKPRAYLQAAKNYDRLDRPPRLPATDVAEADAEKDGT